MIQNEPACAKDIHNYIEDLREVETMVFNIYIITSSLPTYDSQK